LTLSDIRHIKNFSDEFCRQVKPAVTATENTRFGGVAWLIRVRHGYGKTRGFSKMGSAGTGTVVDFGTPWHTVYPYCGIAGMHRYISIR
jgi:hypothetical protein